MTTLGELLERIGPPVLSLRAAPRGLDVPIRGVSIHDPADAGPCGSEDLVIIVGLPPGAAPLPVLRDLAGHGASAALVKDGGELEPQALRASELTGVALLSVPPGSSWSRVLTWLRSAVTDDPLERPAEAFGGLVTGDLFALANAIAAVVDAPVTIEDPQLRVLAFSRRQEEADRARLGTILGQQTPAPFAGRMREHGVLRRIYASRRPVFVRGLPPDILPRLAVAVRAGDEVLGTIWAVVNERPTRDRLAAFQDAATTASIHLLRHRLVGDARREVRSELVSSLLAGGPMAAEAARRLEFEGACHVVAVGVRAAAGAARTGELSRAWELLQLHLSALHRNAQTAVLQETVYGLVPTHARGGEQAVLRRSMEQYVQRTRPALRSAPRVGVGELARSLDEIPRSRQQAEQALRILLRDAEAPDIAGVDETWVGSILVRLEDMSPHDVAAGRRLVDRLRAHDAENATRYTETVDAWLRHFGDTAGMARELGVHDNTVRFRMRSLRQLGLVDLADPDQRLGLAMMFRLDELVRQEASPG